MSTLDMPQREGICSGFCTCLQTLGVWLQSGGEVTGLSLWALRVWGDPHPIDALTFLLWRSKQGHQGEGNLQS